MPCACMPAWYPATYSQGQHSFVGSRGNEHSLAVRRAVVSCRRQDLFLYLTLTGGGRQAHSTRMHKWDGCLECCCVCVLHCMHPQAKNRRRALHVH